jgi:hypothetical protein
MNDGKSNPPRLAIWFLQHACPGDHDALAGDLIERLREGQTRVWFWRQVLVACGVGILGKIRLHWPQFCYAVAGAEMPMFLWRTVDKFKPAVHWYALPWPWSILLFELENPVMLALAAMPVLAVGLAIDGTFRWLSLLRTATLTLALITLVHFMPDALPGSRAGLGTHQHVPLVYQMLLFSAFLVSAWVGCVPPRRDVTNGQSAT